MKRFWRREERQEAEPAAPVALAEPEPELAFDELGLTVSDDEIAATVAPFVRERYAREDPAWAAIVHDRRARARRKLFGRPEAAEDHNWTQNRTKESYEETWKIDFASWLGTDGPVGPCEWRREGMLARATGMKRVHQLVLMRLFETLQPRNVLEVGSGNGVNLFVLSGRFPDVRFTGIEFTEAGVAATTAVMAEDELPAALRDFSPEPLVDPRAHTRLDVRRADATALPFEDGSFDLVHTVQALELMDPIRAKVLGEMSRVSSGHVAMVEPFFEWHATGHRRDMIAAKGYFAQPIDGLEEFGLKPIVAMADMPHKLDYQPGLVVAEARR